MAPKVDELPELPERSEMIASLAAMEKRHILLVRAAIPADKQPVDAEDHLVVAALRRSLDNIKGFLAMVDQRNVFCGMPIIRFQIDTAMLLFGRTLVTDLKSYAEHIATGKQLRSYKDGNGKWMTDQHLHTELTKKHVAISDLYSEASAYVHFSTQHMHRVLDLERHIATNEVIFKDPDDLTAGWSDEEACGALVCMVWATSAILTECDEWLAAKRTVAERGLVSVDRAEQ
jgi:hypothetical protein